MKHFVRSVSRQIGKLVSAKLLFNSDAPVFLPFYHVVSDQKLKHIQSYPYRNEKEFEQELEYLLTYFQPVSLAELISGKTKKKYIFHLSFDDGLKECSDVIAPILIKKGIPASFFVNSGFVDNKKLFHKYKASLVLNELSNKPDEEVQKLLIKKEFPGHEILKVEKQQEQVLDELAKLVGIDFNKFLAKEKPYLTTEQILDLKEKGFTIGAHSTEHEEFYRLSTEKQIDEIEESVKWVTKNIHPEIKAFSFPFTDDGVPAIVLKTIRDRKICDVSFRTAGVKYDEFDFHLQRYPVEQTGNFVENIKGEYVYFLLRKLLRKATVTH
jgi:peptidoglycan/xylan/chitin deacetylase (PgdA/CDA1 family)